MEKLHLNRTGFLTGYLVSGPRETDFINHETDDNQLRYEKYLRSIAADHDETVPEGTAALGENSRLGMPWRYYYHYGNWFVDESTFYSTLQKVEFDAVTGIQAEEELTVKAVLWSYGAVDVWCNREHVCSMDIPVYKPIRKENMELHLKKGVNRIYVGLQTLGVRDTRTLFGIQILDHRDEITVVLPDEEKTDDLVRTESWLGTLRIQDSVMTFGGNAPEGTWLAYDSQSPDFARVESRKEWLEISGKDRVVLDGEKPGVIHVSVRGKHAVLTRTVENILAQKPVYSDKRSFEENKKSIFRRIGEAESLSRGDKFGFSISNILARKALGMDVPRDTELLYETLDQIESRYDCSDFLVCGLVRYLKNYPVDGKMAERAKEVLLNWRYWMDQNGSDAMCFWSENHSLMFYTCAMNVGEMYPDDYFPRADMTGRELYSAGRRRVECWLTDVEEHGFEEFLSTVYMCVTFAALLNVIDYSGPEISRRAAAVTGRLLEMLCRHTYDGVIIAPMGRVYREVVHPFEQGAQALMNLINPVVPYSFGEGWLGFYGSSSYQLPSGLKELMEHPADISYSTGNALIRLKKTGDYCMTSVQSPRRDPDFKRWENVSLRPDGDPSACEYTKSLNERFHGTTCFEPGVYGYQQHMWYAALDKETDIFTNHPGGTCDSSSMRPGFWYGNGVMPALTQEENMLGAVYHIPDEHPIHFTHAYFPTPKFQETRIRDHWLLSRQEKGFAALWCSGVMEPADDQLFDCEYRTYGSDIAYFCVCGSSQDFRSLDEFEAFAQGLRPEFRAEDRTLTAGRLNLRFTENHDKTQYI
ncbi:hypothetical protein AALB39_15905 [Lachnospiraceae bacterium 54-53]